MGSPVIAGPSQSPAQQDLLREGKCRQNVASGWLTVAAGAQEPQCTGCVHEDSEHRGTLSGARAVVLPAFPNYHSKIFQYTGFTGSKRSCLVFRRPSPVVSTM